MKKVIQKEIDLIDIGIGNIGSIKRCLDRLNISFRIVDANNQPDGKRPIVFPGVGHFGSIMHALQKNKLDASVRNFISSGTPYLGICVGLQILFESSEESPDMPGLGLLKGNVIRFQHGKIPQIGWNLLKANKEPQNALSESAQYVYFVNSYYVKPSSKEIITHTADYFEDFCAAIQSNNITAVQFHPEKSGKFGSQFIKEWLSSVN